MWRGVSTFCAWTKPQTTQRKLLLLQQHGWYKRCLSGDFKRKLTTLEALGEAPFWSRIFTILRWPINDATCKGVRPDCYEEEHRFAEWWRMTSVNINLSSFPLYLPQSLPLMMQSVSEGDPSHACGSFYKQYVKEWSHSGGKNSKSAINFDRKIKSTVGFLNLSSADQRPWVGFAAFVQQYFGHAVMAAVCCHVQRGEVVQRDVINLSVVL